MISYTCSSTVCTLQQCLKRIEALKVISQNARCISELVQLHIKSMEIHQGWGRQTEDMSVSKCFNLSRKLRLLLGIYESQMLRNKTACF